MHSIKATPKMVDGLRWFLAHGPVAWYPCDGSAPSNIIRKRLKTAGWIEQCGSEPLHGAVFFRITRYQISEAGRNVLADIKS